MNFLTLVWQWLTNASNWTGENGVPTRLSEHLTYSATALVVAAAIALPVGLLTGHFRRGGSWSSASAMRRGRCPPSGCSP